MLKNLRLKNITDEKSRNFIFVNASCLTAIRLYSMVNKKHLYKVLDHLGFDTYRSFERSKTIKCFSSSLKDETPIYFIARDFDPENYIFNDVDIEAYFFVPSLEEYPDKRYSNQSKTYEAQTG